MKKYIFRAIPLLLALMLILGLTMQNTSENVELSEMCRAYAVRLADHFNIDTMDAWWNTPAHFRKVGHVIEYLLLGMGVYYLIRVPFVSFVICIVVSYCDQYLKSRLPIRHFDITDIPFDALGCLVGITVMVTTIKFIKNIRGRK